MFAPLVVVATACSVNPSCKAFTEKTTEVKYHSLKDAAGPSTYIMGSTLFVKMPETP